LILENIKNIDDELFANFVNLENEYSELDLMLLDIVTLVQVDFKKMYIISFPFPENNQNIGHNSFHQCSKLIIFIVNFIFILTTLF
jgi:hypothetical protein